MPVRLRDVGLPTLTVIVLSPVAALCFKLGIPIELIVFGLLVAGYKGPRLLQARKKQAEGGGNVGGGGAASGGKDEQVRADSAAGKDADNAHDQDVKVAPRATR